MSPNPRGNEQKLPIFLVLSIHMTATHTYLLRTVVVPTYIRSIDLTISTIIYPYPLFVSCGKPTHMERTTDSLTSFVRSCELLLLLACALLLSSCIYTHGNVMRNLYAFASFQHVYRAIQIAKDMEMMRYFSGSSPA